MCGIAGIAGAGALSAAPEVLAQMCQRIQHRGPDDQGLGYYPGVHMGMQRLAVIDLKSGNQPVTSANNKAVITYNGELYNYKELRAELIAAGFSFRTNSDTEVVATGYEAWGESLFERLNGMFAIAIFDQVRNQLLLVRDHIGIKPLYIAQLADTLVWGSEIKSLLAYHSMPRQLDTLALQEFLAWEYVPEERTLFKDVRRLCPGTFLRFDLNQRTSTINQYWSIANAQEIPSRSREDWRDELGAMLKRSVQDQLVSDVPLGAFLSGGVDSSLIVAHMGRERREQTRTFSIGFEDPSYNELEYARVVANHLGVDHTSEVIDPDALGLFDQLMYHMDDPIGDFSIFPTYLVSRMTKKHVTVALSGDGGDEMFGGYDTYVAQHYGAYYDKLPDLLRSSLIPSVTDLLPPTSQKKGVINKIKRFTQGGSLPERLGHARWRLFATAEELKEQMVGEAAAAQDVYGHIERLRNACDELDPVNQALYIDAYSYLTDNCLPKIDRMSMAVSLETRVPFLDPELMQTVFRMPGEHKLSGGETKPLLKELAAQHVPHSCVYRNKEGFSIPIKQWLVNDFSSLVDNFLSRERLEKQGIFNADYTQRLVNEHMANKANHSHRLWSLIVFQAWSDKWLDGSRL